MKRGASRTGVLVVLVLLVTGTVSAQVPAVIKFSGMLADGGPARTVAATFSVYADLNDDAPLWQETQPIAVDAAGRYAVLLGATRTDGLPTALFAAGEARWIGVRAEGHDEQSRVALVSVPYALKAEDATTVGGKPLSAFVLAGERTGIGADGLTYVDTRVLQNGLATSGGSGAAGPPSLPIGSGATSATAGSANYLALFTDPATLGNSAIYQTPAGRLGINTLVPQAPLHLMSTEQPAGFFDVYSGASVLGALPVVYRAARGTPAAPAAVQADDILGGLAVRGFNGSAFTGGRGQVMFKAAENWTTTGNGTYLTVSTEPLGAATTAAERLRIMADGRVGIGTTAPEQLLTVNGVVQSTFGGFKFPDGTAMLTAVRLSANTFTATQTINSGNLALPSTSGAASGVLTLGGAPFLHAFGAATNTFVGGLAGGDFAAVGGGNVGVGYAALKAATTGWSNTAVGLQTLAANTTGASNTAVGAQALSMNQAGTSNAAFGAGALLFNLGNANAGFGALSLYKNTSGINNVAVGAFALYANTTGSDNVGVGPQALLNNTVGVWNTAVGSNAMQFTTTGQANTAVGQMALNTNHEGTGNSAFGATALAASLGDFNSAFGYQAMRSNTTGLRGTAVGAGALGANTTGSSNTAVGDMALYGNVAGGGNSAFGAGALQNNTVHSNSAFGNAALMNNTSGDGNTAVGNAALTAATTAAGNTAVGFFSLGHTTTSGANTAVGNNALLNNTTGTSNTGVGYQALFLNETGDYNTALGRVALNDLSSGNYNTGLGTNAGNYLTTGSFNTFAGWNARPDSTVPALDYATAVGAGAVVGASSSLVLGGTGTYAVNVGINTTTPIERLQVVGDIRAGTSGTNGCVKNFNGGAIAGTSCSSDLRLKSDVRAFGSVLNRVAQLTPVHFFWRSAEFPSYRFGPAEESGLIAQDVEQMFPELVQTDEHGFKTVNYTELPLLAIAAVKELKAKNDALEAEGHALEAKHAALESKLAALAERLAKLEKQ